jgi:hypothetical protein
VKIALLALLEALEVAAALVVVVASEEGLAPEEASVAAAASEAASEDVEATQEVEEVEVLVVVLPVVAQVSSLALPQTRPTLSPTSLLLVESLATQSTFAICHGQPATRILSSCSPRLARSSELRFSMSLTVALAELVLSNSKRTEMLRQQLVSDFKTKHLQALTMIQPNLLVTSTVVGRSVSLTSSTPTRAMEMQWRVPSMLVV